MATPTILIVPDRFKSGVLYSQLPESGAVDFGVTRATTAYRTNASGILESVASGVPRLDYPAAGGCPSLLVEPAATNLALRSEEFNDAYWGKSGGTTVTANTTIAPDGTLTADTITFPTGSSINVLISSLSITSGNTYTFSCYIKSSTQKIFFGGATSGAGTVVYNGAVDVGSGWFRQSITRTWTATGTFNIQLLLSGGGLASYEAWGAQLEVGSVATSYIPTVAATATRNADVISKTGVSGFIGQTEGTIYAEVDVRALSSSRIFASLADSTDTIASRIRLGIISTNIIYGQIGSTATNTIVATSGVYKVAIAYDSSGFVVYVNGSSYGSEITATSGVKSVINLGSTAVGANFLNDRIRAAAIYPTRLSNAELSALTTL